MAQEDSRDRDGEVVVAVSHAGLTRSQLRAAKEAFKNVLISRIPAGQSTDAKQKPGVLKQRATVKQKAIRPSTKCKGAPTPARPLKGLGTGVTRKAGKTP